jgi:hypothetical protein
MVKLKPFIRGKKYITRDGLFCFFINKRSDNIILSINYNMIINVYNVMYYSKTKILYKSIHAYVVHITQYNNLSAVNVSNSIYTMHNISINKVCKFNKERKQMSLYKTKLTVLN